jgi:hypothetical protein
LVGKRNDYALFQILFHFNNTNTCSTKNCRFGHLTLSTITGTFLIGRIISWCRAPEQVFADSVPVTLHS